LIFFKRKLLFSVMAGIDRVQELEKIQNEAKELFSRKNADYGDAYMTYGVIGILVRLGDKIRRLQTITAKGINLVEDEKLRETLIDLHNYAAMGIMTLDGDVVNDTKFDTSSVDKGQTTEQEWIEPGEAELAAAVRLCKLDSSTPITCAPPCTGAPQAPPKPRPLWGAPACPSASAFNNTIPSTPSKGDDSDNWSTASQCVDSCPDANDQYCEACCRKWAAEQVSEPIIVTEMIKGKTNNYERVTTKYSDGRIVEFCSCPSFQYCMKSPKTCKHITKSFPEVS
jgi:hypothetical protein